tara:strand:- start:932 stop:1147 length:216 start_codon:yes stop_codon:yes gene_type:complete
MVADNNNFRINNKEDVMSVKKTRTNINLVSGSSAAPASKPRKRKMISKSKGKGKVDKPIKRMTRGKARGIR